jgi:acyl-CoA thioester hydrolase
MQMSHITSLSDPARIVLRRRIEWIDTDAAGIYHWTTAFRLAEAAEAALHTALGIAGRTFGVTPRVGVSARFTRPLRFNDPVEVEFAVAALGRTSVRYAFVITGPDGPAVTGEVSACLIDRESGRPAAWPDDIRGLLESGGSAVADRHGDA